MIAVILASILTLFTPVSYPQVHSTFDLYGVDISSGTPERTLTAPVLMKSEDGDFVAFSFIAPISGACRVLEVLKKKDGEEAALVIAGRDEVTKGSTQIARAFFAPPEQISSLDATTDGYTFAIVCGDPVHPKDSAVYSKVYHIDRPVAAP